MPTYRCSRCVVRAASHRFQAMKGLPQARFTLDLLRERLLALPKSASVRVQDPLAREMTDYGLTARDLDRILARGQAISRMRDKAHEGYWLTIRLVTGGQEQHIYHLVLHYTWPPIPTPQTWIMVATHVYEPDERYDDDGYPSCWCIRPALQEQEEGETDGETNEV